MLSIYIGVYKAVYDYDAQAEEELSTRTDDLLYLLERSDIDDWWKVKKRVIATGDEVVDEPSGLVPSTYIEEVCTTHLVIDSQLNTNSSSPPTLGTYYQTGYCIV